ncbi:PAS domain-containing protein [Flavobacterium sp.]|uniref:sensor histidine kinase n=1 Tax=Flavobacterium sp. TaxID=239 RepID=UPI0012131D75|nr:PAS domain-containing protein [Flavobacterium sp.]RZJ70706.1 MAG: PAS domain S-box protein [Flavobacterium sp.]
MIPRQRKSTFDWFASHPKTSGVLATFLLALIVTLIAFQRYHMSKANEQREMHLLIDAAHQNLEQSIKSCYASSLSIAMTINDDGVPEDFDRIASELLQSNNLIHTLELVPGGVIKYIYPTIGNEKALGFDILNSPDHKIEAMRSVNDGKMYFAGPILLKQGGMGIIGRLPVYRKGKFWGFSAVLIKPETLYRYAGLKSIDENKFYFQLVKTNPSTGQIQYFLPGEDSYNGKNFVTREIPDGGWKLILASKDNYRALWIVFPILLFGMAVALLFGFLVTVLLEKPAQAARESEAKFESLFNDSPIALWEEDFSHVKRYLVDMNLMERDFLFLNDFFRKNPNELKNCLSLVKIINVNNECLRLHYPKTREELLAEGLDSIIGSDVQDDFVRQIAAVSKSLTTTSMDTVMKVGNGSYRQLFLQWTVMKGCEETLDRVIVATEDITDRKESEKLIYNSQQKIESLVNTIDGIVWESDFENDNISFVNAQAEEISGYPVEQWLSEPNFWTNHVHPEDRESTIRAYMENVRKNKQFEFEYRFIKKDGSILWVKDYVSVVFEKGAPAYVRGIMMDISDSKESDRKLNESLKLVIEQNKRLQNFSYIVSHNLRSHTSNIQSIAVLMDAADSENERKQMIGMLRTVSASLNETMTNLNEVVNIQTNISLVSEDLNVRHYVENALAVLSEQIAIKAADIKVEVPKTAEILFNPAYLESILLNLISNAIRYSSSERDPKVLVKWTECEASKILEVSDNGIGIDLEKYGDQIFGMYKTFSSNPDSRGIGLFITKNQVEAMGGSISAESQPGHGTKFIVKFK